MSQRLFSQEGFAKEFRMLGFALKVSFSLYSSVYDFFSLYLCVLLFFPCARPINQITFNHGAQHQKHWFVMTSTLTCRWNSTCLFCQRQNLHGSSEALPLFTQRPRTSWPGSPSIVDFSRIFNPELALGSPRNGRSMWVIMNLLYPWLPGGDWSKRAKLYSDEWVFTFISHFVLATQKPNCFGACSRSEPFIQRDDFWLWKEFGKASFSLQCITSQLVP